MRAAAGLAVAAALNATPAQADELFAGLLAHDVASPFSAWSYEDGADVQIGWRGARLEALRPIGAPSPYALGSIATGGSTHYVAAGLSWRIGGRLFVRPAAGLAVHSRRDDGVVGGFRTDLGSRLLFAPELGVGYRVSEDLTVEASWVHLSHAGLFDRQNPGMDSVGIRLSYALR